MRSNHAGKSKVRAKVAGWMGLIGTNGKARGSSCGKVRLTVQKDRGIYPVPFIVARGSAPRDDYSSSQVRLDLSCFSGRARSWSWLPLQRLAFASSLAGTCSTV
jgi:hypothetical protein